MTKIMLLLSFVGLLLLVIFSMIAPSSPIMWLSATSAMFTYIRLGLMAIITLLIVTDPPRNLFLRVFVGLSSVLLIGWSTISTYQNHMQLADAFLFISTGLSFGITALERNIIVECPIKQIYATRIMRL